MAELAIGVPAGVPAANALNVARPTTAASNAARQFPARQTDTKRVTAPSKRRTSGRTRQTQLFVSILWKSAHTVRKTKNNLQVVTNSIVMRPGLQKNKRVSYRQIKMKILWINPHFCSYPTTLKINRNYVVFINKSSNLRYVMCRYSDSTQPLNSARKTVEDPESLACMDGRQIHGPRQKSLDDFGCSPNDYVRK